MSYEINDRTLIEEMCGDIRNTAQAEYEKLKERLKQGGRDLPGDFAFPLDEDIVGPEGDLKKLLSDQENAISYSKAGKLDNLWRSLLNKSIVCLRYFDTREPFLDNPNKEELREWILKSKIDVNKFFNTSGVKYRELGLKDKLKDMSFDEKIELLASDGMLVKRPLIIGDKIIIGFKNYEEML